jgi:hypothetical protein
MASAILDHAASQGRSTTQSEHDRIETLLAEAEQAAASDRRLEGVLKGSPSVPGVGLSFILGTGGGSVFMGGGANAGVPFGQGPGDVFVNSDGFKAIMDPARRSDRWSSGLVEVTGPPTAYAQTKGTLMEGSGSPGSGSGGGLVPSPQVLPGVVTTLFQPLSVEGQLQAVQADGNTFRYVSEGTATSAAAGVAEAGTKPESTLGLSTKDEPIKKIATFLPVSDEMLEDAPQIQMYLNNRLATFISIEVERQLVRGTAGGNEVRG